MHLNYLTLERQAHFLNRQTGDFIIAESFTQNRNEWILLCRKDDQELVLQLSCDGKYPHVILLDYVKRRRNSVDVMPEVLGWKIAGVELMRGERIMTMLFSGREETLVLRLFTNRSNFLLVDGQQTIITAFKSGRDEAGNAFKMQEQSSPFLPDLDLEEFTDFLLDKEDLSLEKALRRIRPFNARLAFEALKRTGIDGKQKAGVLGEEEILSLWEGAWDLLADCQNGQACIYQLSEYEEVFTPCPFRSMEGEATKTFDDVNSALRSFNFRAARLMHVGRSKTKYLQLLSKKIDKLDHSVEKLRANKVDPQKKAHYQRIGQLIASQPHLIEANVRQVTLIDYYDENMPEITVNIDPERSAKDNAEAYFKRARQYDDKVASYHKKADTLEKQLRELSVLRESLEAAETVKALEKVEEQLKAARIVQPDKAERSDFRLPYKEYFWKDFPVRVGRSAKDNDQLTFKHSAREDIWMHVQGYSGSHVVIPNPARLDSLPNDLLTYAARLAVTFSTAKHASYVPVLYTQIRYVRKPRKSPPGTVVPANTKTIFVDPLGPDELM